MKNKLLRYFSVKTDHPFQTGGSDIIIIDKELKLCQMLDVVVLADNREKIIEHEGKYR